MKKKLLLCSLFAALAAAPAFSQNFADLMNGVTQFSDYVTPALPSAASIGLNWSDAWVGDLVGIPPHFGVGATVGAVALPLKGFDSILAVVGGAIPKELEIIKSLGIPFPVYCAEARIGGYFLPFDIGFKYGTLPADLKTGSLSLDYTMAGADVRFAILKDGLLLPGLSVGAGISYLKGGVGYALSDFTLATVPTGPSTTGTLALTRPRIAFSWDTLVYDFKVQISKSLLLITPYAGLAASWANSKAGGGFYSTLTLNGTPVSQTDLDALNQYAGASFSSQGLEKIVQKNGTLTFRAYGGMSLNIIVVRLDTQAIWTFGDLSKPGSGALGVTLGARVQL